MILEKIQPIPSNINQGLSMNHSVCIFIMVFQKEGSNIISVLQIVTALPSTACADFVLSGCVHLIKCCDYMFESSH